MLTGYQCEVVAFIGEGEFICHACAHKALDEGHLAQCELGLGSLSPVIRYSLDEYNGERVYEAAQERVSDWVADHRDLAIALGVYDRPNVVATGFTTLSQPADRNRWRIIDKVVEKLGNSYDEACGECSEVIS